MRTPAIALAFLLTPLAPFQPLSAQTPAEAAAAKVDAQKLLAEGQSLVNAGDADGAIAVFERLTKAAPDFGRGWHMLGYSLHMAGRLDEALKVHLKATAFADVAPVATYNVACVHSLQGHADQAFEWLDKAAALGFNDRGQLANDTDFDNIRKDARFEKLMKSMSNRINAFVVTTKRESARVAYFGADGSPGQIAIDYSPVPWRADYDKQVGSKDLVGKKWRFGSDFWTTLDNSMPLVIGGVEVPAGYWYLTLCNQGDGRFVLGVHDPAVARKHHLDPFKADALPAGIEVPLRHDTIDEVAETLSVGIVVPDRSQNTKGTLKIAFGGHRLSADVDIGLAK